MATCYKECPMENHTKSFDEAYAKLVQNLIRKEEPPKKNSSMASKIAEVSGDMLGKYVVTYLFYLHAKQNPAQVSELLSLFQESCLKEVSRQTELAHDKLANDPMFTMMQSLFELPSIEGVEGMYIQEINRLVEVYREFLGVPQTENT